jgi:aquaporin Z
MLKKLIAECLGTFVLVFVACGTAALTHGNVVATSLVFGIALIAMAYTVGLVSGCHINPAVSLGLAINKKISWTEFALYVCAQIVGGLLAAIIFFGLTKWCLAGTGVDLYYVSGNASNFAPFYSAFGKLNAARIITALVVEIVLTFIFVYVILNVTSEKSDAKNIAGLIIGITLIGVHLVGISITGTSVNPARSIATAVSTAIYGGGKEALKQVWMFIVGPMAGACLAGVFYKFFHNDETSSTEE